MMAHDLHVVIVPQHDRRLGRQAVHDERSRSFATPVTVDTATWYTKRVRIYDPYPNPNQCHGECTGCAKATQLNAVGNRVTGQVLKLDTAHQLYSRATQIDPWPGAWPPDDTGSSGLAAAKAAQEAGLAGRYEWLFGGVDQVVQAVMAGLTVNVGTWWYWAMFDQDSAGIVAPTGSRAGGHEWTVRGYDADRDLVLGRCWWGTYRDFWIAREHLGDLLADDGDAHLQERLPHATTKEN